MHLNTLKPGEGARTERKRVGGDMYPRDFPGPGRQRCGPAAIVSNQLNSKLIGILIVGPVIESFEVRRSRSE